MMPESYHPFADTLRHAEVVQMLARVKGKFSQSVQQQPTHSEYLSGILG